MDFAGISLIAVAIFGYVLMSTVSLKLWTWLAARFLVTGGQHAPGIFRCCGIVILWNVVAAGIGYVTFTIFDYLFREPGARSSNAMAIGGIVYYPLIFIATILILKKLTPTSYLAAILINLAQIFASFMILAVYMGITILIAYDFGRKH